MENDDGMSYSRKEYISPVPRQQIRRFTGGDPTEDYDLVVSLIANTNTSISSRALEAARVTVNKALTSTPREKIFFLKVKTYPHEIVRSHKFMGFAGADRLSQGMRKAFGKPIGRAARVEKDQKILSLRINEEDLDLAKEALERASKKLPVKYNIDIEKISDLVE